MQTSSAVLDVINAVERDFPVGEWRVDDLHLWPAFRFRTYSNAMDDSVLRGDLGSSSGRLRRLLNRAARALWRVPAASWRDRTMNDRPRPGTSAVFFSDGVSFVNLGGKWYDRVMDPLVQEFAQRGLCSLKLTPLAEVHVPRYLPSWFVQPRIDRIKLRARGAGLELELPEFDGVIARLREAMGDNIPSRDWLQVQAGRLEALASWFGDLLATSGASLAFANTYYSLEGMAFVQAARRNGIVSVDLQHGIQGSHHVAYARWASVPAAGYSTLPDQFWVWGDDEAAAINAWQDGKPRHVPLVTGNYWMQRWIEAREPLIEAAIQRMRELREAGGPRVHLLVCGTWGVAEEETDKLIDAVKQLDRSIVCWWRLHPVMAARHQEFSERLARAGLDGRLVHEVTNAPLYAVLSSVDMVLAHSSTVIREAAQFGLQSVVTSPYGAELHDELVRNGVVRYAADVPAIVQGLHQLARAPIARVRPLSLGSRLADVIENTLPRVDS